MEGEKLDMYEECIYIKQESKFRWVVIEDDNLKGLRISYINNRDDNKVVTEIRCDNGRLTSMTTNLSGWDN